MADTVDLGKFPAGKNNVAKETSLPVNSKNSYAALRDAINVDIDDSGNIRRREGYTLLYSGIDIDSLYKRYFREAGELKYLNDDNTATVIATVSGSVNYTEINELIYWTDGSLNGIISVYVSKSLGIPTPQITGQEPVGGDIQTTYTYRDQVTGEESGAARGMVNATSFSKSGYDLIEWNTTGDDGRFYDSSGRILETQFMNILPAGQIIEYYKGKMYVAQGSILWYSQPHRYGLVKTSENFFSFPSRITICIAVDAGLFVVADKTYFISFNKNEEATLSDPSEDKGVEGTGLVLMGSDLGLEDLGDTEVAYWFGEKGAMIGLPDGTVQNLTKERLAVSDNTSQVGSSLFKEFNGIKQVLSAMPKGDAVSKLQASDSATLTIYRDGVLVE